MGRNLLTVISSIVCFCQLIGVNKATVTYLNQSCVVGSNYTERSVYQRNLNSLLSNLSSKTSTHMFFNSTLGDFPNKVYGLYQCRADLSTSACRECVQDAVQKIVQVCPINKEAIIWYYECILRYANRSIFSIMETYPNNYQWGLVNVSSYGQLAPVLASTMDNIIHQAAAGTALGHFAVGSANWSMFETVYCLAQCTPDISDLDCRNCLELAAVNVMITVYNTSGRVKIFYPSCQLRYDANSYQFYRDIPLAPTPSNMPIPNGPGRTISMKVIIAIVIPVVAVLVATLIVIGICCAKQKKTKDYDIAKTAEIEDIRSVESLQYDLSTIRTATRNFSTESKLGEGGFGEVYKGKLDGGKDIAVKRLSTNSVQGVAEFKTEVVLVAKLQHKNLVKLLGFCVDSSENILVYEFLSNSSLDRLLFAKKASLDWQTRYKIILGVARGLLYLHEDSRLKVIHRDLKPSNILLDEAMNPKISDFGLAKLFCADETQGDTRRIVGTYGYMAPEYAITGHYSVKSDVYSFGVVMLEIVSGQKNRFFGRKQVEEALLHRAWRLWNEEKALDLVDPTLMNKFPMEEVVKCIHVGLLCVQEEAFNRPRMTTIVGALTGQSISIPMPKLPLFFGSNNTTDEDHQYNAPVIYSGTEIITDLYSRE